MRHYAKTICRLVLGAFVFMVSAGSLADCCAERWAGQAQTAAAEHSFGIEGHCQSEQAADDYPSGNDCCPDINSCNNVVFYTLDSSHEHLPGIGKPPLRPFQDGLISRFSRPPTPPPKQLA